MIFRLSKIRAVIFLFFPNIIINYYYKCKYHELESFKIGFSWLDVDKFEVRGNVKIGHLNFIKQKSLFLQNSTIGFGNRILGNFDTKLRGDLGNFNVIRNANKNPTSLDTGEDSKITSNHYLDLCGNITLGKGALLAGRGTQIWTHSYGYFNSERFRIDADVMIGENSYIGSRATLQSPLSIGNRVTLASGCSITGKYLDDNISIVPASNRRIQLKDSAEKLDKFNYESKDESEPCLTKILK